MTTHRKHSNGNVASPEQSTEAMAEWATEDLMAAEPYPMPEITEEMVKDFHRQDDGAYGQRRKHFAGGAAKFTGWRGHGGCRAAHRLFLSAAL